MKYLFTLLTFGGVMLISGNSFAQNQMTSQTKSYNIKNNNPLVMRMSKPLYNDEFGQNFNTSDLSRLPFRNINSIANTVAGVQSYGGGIPNIKGAPASGTAYFVDGVRVYGALPNMK